MSRRMTVQVFVPLLLVVVMAAAFVMLITPAPDIQIDSLFSRPRVQEPFNVEAAAELSAYRWQAMAEFYENNELLDRGRFNYAAASELVAYRWQALASFYEDNQLLTRDASRSEAAAAPFARIVRYANSTQMNNEGYLATLGTQGAPELSVSAATFARIVRYANSAQMNNEGYLAKLGTQDAPQIQTAFYSGEQMSDGRYLANPVAPGVQEAAINPELRAHGRYHAEQAAAAEMAMLVQNPELKLLD